MFHKTKIALIGALLVASASVASAQSLQRYDNYDSKNPTTSYSSQGNASEANKIIGGENGGA